MGVMLFLICLPSPLLFLLPSRLLRGDVGKSKLLQVSVYHSVLILLCHPSVFSLPS